MCACKFKYLLLLSTVLGAWLDGTSANAACTNYAPSSNITVTCSGSVTTGIDAQGSTNVTINLEDGTVMSTGGGFLYAIGLGEDSSLNLYGSASVTSIFYAAFAVGNGSTITLNDSSSITTTGVYGDTAAIFAEGDTRLLLNDASSINSVLGIGIVLSGSGGEIIVSADSRVTARGAAIVFYGANLLVNYGTLDSEAITVTGSDDSGQSDDIRNYGAIITTGSSAIDLRAGDDTLSLGTGSSITGSINGGWGVDDLTLVGSGSEDSDISNFELLTINGIDWTLAGQTSFTDVVINSGILTLTQGLGFASPGSLDNHGTLIADITGSSGSDAIVNYGTITGAIDLSDGGDMLTLGTGSSISGGIDGGDGTDSVTLTGSGSEDGDFSNFESLTMAGTEWILSGTSSFGSLAVDSGILRLNGMVTGDVEVLSAGTLGGIGTIVGNVTSSGTLSAGNSVGTATIIGDLVQYGGSFVEFDAGGVDRWNVTGTATLVNNPTLTISSLDGSSTAHGVILHADGGIAGSFADPPIYDGNGGVSIEQTTNDIILTVLDGTSIVADHHAALQTAMSFFDQLAVSNLTGCGAQTSMHAHSQQGCRGRFWLEGFGQAGNEEAQGGNKAYDYSFVGTAVGAEAMRVKGMSFGASLGLSASEVDIPANASTSSMEGIIGALYSRFERAGAFFSAAIGGGSQNIDLSHTAVLGAERLSVETDTRAWLMGAGLKAGVELNAGFGWSIVPSGGLTYLHQWVNGYEEEIGTASAVIDPHDAGLLRLRGDVELRHRRRQDGVVYSPHVKLGVIDNFGRGGVATGAFSSGTGFELSLAAGDKLRGVGGIGLEAEFVNGSMARIGYEGEASSSSAAHALTLEVKVFW